MQTDITGNPTHFGLPVFFKKAKGCVLYSKKGLEDLKSPLIIDHFSQWSVMNHKVGITFEEKQRRMDAMFSGLMGKNHVNYFSNCVILLALGKCNFDHL